jgi:phospholipase/lecithinase/hemolysin
LYGNDPMQAVFVKGSRAGNALTNFAVYGAPSNAMIQQIVNYAPRYFGSGRATTISFQIGANDIMQNYALLAGSPPGTNPSADGVIDNLLTNIANDFVLLWLAHPKATFVLWTVPDVTHAPRYWSVRSTQGAANVRAHVARINSLLRLLDAVANITILDIDTRMRAISLNPPTVGVQQLLAPPVTRRHDALFADIVHPTAVSNGLLANEIIKALNAQRGTSIPKWTDCELATLATIRCR